VLTHGDTLGSRGKHKQQDDSEEKACAEREVKRYEAFLEAGQS
jgi:hypothetical protein